MDFAFTEDQTMIRDSARDFLGERADHAHLRSTLESNAGWDKALWQDISEMGWPGLSLAEEYGGSALGPIELCIVLEEMGRVLAPIPFFETVLAAELLKDTASPDMQARLLPHIASGALRITQARMEDSAAYLQDGALHGAIRFVPFAQAANLFLLPLCTKQGTELYALPADLPGLRLNHFTSLDLTRPYSDLHLENVAVTADHLITRDAGAALLKNRAMAAGLLAAEQVGGMDACLKLTVDYAQQRIQFGRAIGSFQAVKHRMADMAMLIEGAKSAAYYAAAAMADNLEELFEAASVARAYCSDAYIRCASDAIQLHGGIGFTWEHPAHLYFKRARAAATLLGTADQHREVLARIIGLDERPEFI